MYDELVKRLWECASGECFNCSQYTLTTNASVCSKELMEQAADAIEELSKKYLDSEVDNTNLTGWLAEEHAKHLWIPVEERLPETGVDVLVMFPHNMAVASRDMGEWVVNSGDGWCTDVNLSDDEKEPTHWMPLPQPPKEE